MQNDRRFGFRDGQPPDTILDFSLWHELSETESTLALLLLYM